MTPSFCRDFILAALVEEVVVVVFVADVVVSARVLVLIQKGVGLLDDPEVH
jgi:hypothetical protein